MLYFCFPNFWSERYLPATKSWQIYSTFCFDPSISCPSCRFPGQGYIYIYFASFLLSLSPPPFALLMQLGCNWILLTGFLKQIFHRFSNSWLGTVGRSVRQFPRPHLFRSSTLALKKEWGGRDEEKVMDDSLFVRVAGDGINLRTEQCSFSLFLVALMWDVYESRKATETVSNRISRRKSCCVACYVPTRVGLLNHWGFAESDPP